MLISTIAQLRAASSVNVSNNIDNWLPYLSDAEEMFIIPVIGQPLYDLMLAHTLYDPNPRNPEVDDELGTGDQSPDAPTADLVILLYDELLLKIRKSIALYALFLGVDEMSLSISSAGIQVIQSDTHKAAPQYQIMNLKETYLTRAHRQIDLILKFLTQNTSAFDQYYHPSTPCFIRNADEFQVYSDIHSSRRVFLSLLPVMGSIEQKYIKPTLSPELFNSLKSEFRSDVLSEENKILIDFIVPALVHLTMARALLEISIDTLDWGIFNSSTNTFNNIQTKAQENRNRVSSMHEANQRDGEAELKMLQEFLDNNASADKYALYFNSSRYAGAELSVKRGEFVNESSKSIFVV
ncbi:MAG: hypothetical protein NTW16_06755 [Bacteroidetes bacterium]|nr:hypothetical protein [Bacteroidota bacterium]